MFNYLQISEHSKVNLKTVSFTNARRISAGFGLGPAGGTVPMVGSIQIKVLICLKNVCPKVILGMGTE